MCQSCVTEGFMTQEELNARVAAGDQSIAPLMTLSEDEVAKILGELVVESIQNGDSPIAAVNSARRVMAEYRELKANQN